MYVELELPNRAKGKSRGQWMRQIAQQIQAQFPANGKVVTMNCDDILLYLNLYGQFDAEQVAWLNTSPLIEGWSWSPGGFINLSDQTVTTNTFPGEWEIKHDTQVVKLSLDASIGNYLHIDGGPGRKFSTDEALHIHLGLLNIPLTGWTQHIQLCIRCDGPGASSAYTRCPACEQAHRDFMEAPLAAWREATFA